MKTKMIHRVAQLIERYDLSYNEFDRKTGLPTSYISKAIGNQSNIGSHVIEKIYSTFPVDGNWLLGADVPMERDIKLKVSQVAEETETYHRRLTNFEKGVIDCLKNKEAKDIITTIVKEQMSRK